jgi:hypothetical protein
MWRCCRSDPGGTASGRGRVREENDGDVQGRGTELTLILSPSTTPARWQPTAGAGALVHGRDDTEGGVGGRGSAGPAGPSPRRQVRSSSFSVSPLNETG